MVHTAFMPYGCTLRLAFATPSGKGELDGASGIRGSGMDLILPLPGEERSVLPLARGS